MKLRRGIGNEVVDCPATRPPSTAYDVMDYRIACTSGIRGTTVTRDVCILVRPFMQCSSCPESKKK